MVASDVLMWMSYDFDSADVYELDFERVIGEAVHLAGEGAWDVRLRCPDGRKRTVRSLIAKFNLAKYVDAE